MQGSVIRTLQRYLVPRLFSSIYYSLKFRCLVSPHASVQLSTRISFGTGTVVKPYSVIQTQGGRIAVGKKCAVSHFNHITTGMNDLVIGDYVRIGPGVTLLGGSRNFRKKDVLILHQGSSHEGLTIGDDVLIGSGAVILPGCHIAEGAVIGAGCVVTEPVPAYALVAGVPGKVIGHRE